MPIVPRKACSQAPPVSAASHWQAQPCSSQPVNAPQVPLASAARCSCNSPVFSDSVRLSQTSCGGINTLAENSPALATTAQRPSRAKGERSQEREERARMAGLGNEGDRAVSQELCQGAAPRIAEPAGSAGAGATTKCCYSSSAAAVWRLS